MLRLIKAFIKMQDSHNAERIAIFDDVTKRNPKVKAFKV